MYKYVPMFQKRETEDCYDFAFASWMSPALKNVLRAGTVLARESLPLRYTSGNELMDLPLEEFPIPRITPAWMIVAADSE